MNIYISQSALSDYISCNRKAYYRIFKPVEPVKSIYSVKGTIVHKALERGWRNPQDALEVANELCKAYQVPDMEQQDVNHLVRNFFDAFYPFVEENDLLEHNFKIKLDSGVYLVGVFDRVSRGKVFDWKTGKKTPSSLSGNIQFILYNYAYKKVFDSNPTGLYYASLRDKRMVMYREDELRTKVLFDEVIPSYISAVKSNNFTKTGLFNGSCYGCDWKEDCLSKDKE